MGADLQLGDGTITRADQKVTIGEQLQTVDSLREEVVAGANSPENSPGEADLDDVASESTHVGAGVVGGDDDALIDSLDLAHGEVLEEDLLLLVVDVPDADAVVVDSDEVVAGVVVEGNFIGHVHADIVSADGLARLSLI